MIPLDRIQSVDVRRPLLHRLFGVDELRIEVVGGSSAEGRLEALPPAEAAWLRGRLLRQEDAASLPQDGAAVPAAPATTGELLVMTSPRRLVLAGLTGGRVSVAAALAGAAFQLAGDRVEAVVEGVGRRGITTAVGIAAVVVAAVFAISVGATITALWGFRMERRERRLVITRGLLEQRVDTVPLRRVQAVLVEENLVRRLLGVATVRLVVAGREGSAEHETTVVALPLERLATARALAADLLDVLAAADVALTPAPRAALVPRLLEAVVFPAIAATAVAVLIAPWGWSLLGLWVVTVAIAIDSWRSLGTARLDAHLVTRHGSLVRRMTLVPLTRLQIVTHHQGPLRRALNLATVELQIPRTASTPAPRLIDLHAPAAAALVTALSSPT